MIERPFRALQHRGDRNRALWFGKEPQNSPGQTAVGKLPFERGGELLHFCKEGVFLHFALIQLVHDIRYPLYWNLRQGSDQCGHVDLNRAHRKVDMRDYAIGALTSQ